MTTRTRRADAARAAAAQDYPALLAEVKARIQSAQYAALRSVNKELVGLYWDIGRPIVERQQSAGWGAGVVERLSTDLRAAFPGVGGFSTQNLRYMRQFFQEYSAAPKLQPLVGEIGWAHNLLILSRCKDMQEREFYLRMTRKFGWSKNVPAHQIDNQSYEKSLLGQTNFDRALTPALRAQAKLAVRDEYAFDFLELGERHSERELEGALIARIEDFLRAMERRAKAIRANGTDAEIEIFAGLPHGFGLGEGTVAADWLDRAVRFWERQLGRE